jgi:hypothetical protein
VRWQASGRDVLILRARQPGADIADVSQRLKEAAS